MRSLSQSLRKTPASASGSSERSRTEREARGSIDTLTQGELTETDLSAFTESRANNNIPEEPKVPPPKSSFVSNTRNKASERVSTTLTKARQQNDSMRETVSEKKFDTIDSLIDTVAQKEIRKALTADPWMPKIIITKFDELWNTLYPQVMAAIKEAYMAKVGAEGKEYKKKLKDELDPTMWPPPPPPWHPLRWLRAKVLYSVNPADKTIFYTLQSHHVIFLVFAVFPYGVSTTYWFIFMLCMDQRDEYQLVSYIATTRTIWLITFGVCPLLADFFFFCFCSIQDSCSTSAPGTSDLSLISSICLFFNVVTGYYVYWRYRLKRLERFAQYLKDKEDLAKGKLRTLEKFRSAPYFRGLLYYDIVLCVLSFTLCVFTLVYLVPSEGADSSSFLAFFTEGYKRLAEVLTLQAEWEARIVIKLFTVSTALAFLPFALLSIPGLEFLLLKLRSTGYDQQGNLHPLLSTKDMKTKWLRETNEKKSRLAKLKASTASKRGFWSKKGKSPTTKPPASKPPKSPTTKPPLRMPSTKRESASARQTSIAEGESSRLRSGSVAMV